MKFPAIAVAATALFAAPAFADGHATGDAAEGENVFKKCRSCHMIVADDGTEIQKGGRTGPNLYGIYQRVPGSVEDYRYGDSLASISEEGLMPDGWVEEEFVVYVADPKAWLETKVEGNARSKMSYKLRDEQEAKDIWAYLVSVGPAPES
ncbi:c-type cytochrome [Litoreibacter roseus]|uniref:Cytochrome c2 n=1 Tax=Litoreibacter roseus TaxID=2601869 RepID=A0A6N6JES6_9RHOB|nr:c-type cytochrome [Litoreibacter roseus]GFE64645.1 cytochrome c2 [Litoreibacter roseus]